jgi:hypothetical protein
MSGVFRNIDPHPLTARRMCTPLPLLRWEDILAGWRGGGGSIVWKTPDTALCSTYICKYFVAVIKSMSSPWPFPPSPHFQAIGLCCVMRAVAVEQSTNLFLLSPLHQLHRDTTSHQPAMVSRSLTAGFEAAGLAVSFCCERRFYPTSIL